MEQSRRLLLAVVLSFTLVWVVQTLFPPAPGESTGLDAGAAQTGAPPSGDAALAPALVAAEDAAAVSLDAGIAQAQAVVEVPPKRELNVERDTVSLTFSSEGAGLIHAGLKGKKEHVQSNVSIVDGYKRLFGAPAPAPVQIDMAVPSPGLALPFSVSVEGASPLVATAAYSVVEEAADHLTFRARQGPWVVEKTFSWKPQGYEMRMEVRVQNASAEALRGRLVVHTERSIVPDSEEKPSFFGGIGNEASVLCKTTDTLKRVTPSDEGKSEDYEGQVQYFGIDQQYFLTAAFPDKGPVAGSCRLTAAHSRRAAEGSFPIELSAGATAQFGFGLFLGPKDLDLLAGVAQGAGSAGPVLHPSLETSVDFGWWEVICKVLLKAMKWFHDFSGNWGVAIILLTVMVKVLLLPLTHKAMVSAEEMKKLQPKLEELRKKFANDREKQNLETMKLYQEAGVNPVGGCLPLLAQLPIWGALFTTLRTSYELYGEPFYGPVWTDLTIKDPTYLLPLALGVTMILTQRQQPQMGDASQQFMMTWFMPIFFTLIMLGYPAGLALYIFTNNLLSIVQQLALKKYLAGKAAKASSKAQAA